MECRGFCSTLKPLPLDLKRQSVSDITRPDEVEKNSTAYGRAVAVATGRGFKSHQPDSLERQV